MLKISKTIEKTLNAFNTENGSDFYAESFVGDFYSLDEDGNEVEEKLQVIEVADSDSDLLIRYIREWPYTGDYTLTLKPGHIQVSETVKDARQLHTVVKDFLTYY